MNCVLVKIILFVVEVPEKNDADEKRIVPIKVRVKKPQPKLNPER